MIHTPPIYDRRRLETLVAQHRLRVYLAQKKAARKSPALSKGRGCCGIPVLLFAY